MAQKQFTHTARRPHTPESHPHQRYFKRLNCWNGVDDITGVMRFQDEDHADLSVYLQTPTIPLQRASFVAKLTADQCESLARCLLDAAHDLRTFSAAALVAASTEQHPDEVAA